jgi:hypothetical protein
VADIEAKLQGTIDTISILVRSQWAALSAFTHTGMLQITRRSEDGLLIPKYDKAELIRRLRFAGVVGAIGRDRAGKRCLMIFFLAADLLDRAERKNESR